MDFQWVDQSQIGGHQLLPRRWNLYVACVPSARSTHPTHSKNIDPSNNTPMKIYTCYDSLQAQQWYYTNDKRIALEGQGRKSRHLRCESGRQTELLLIRFLSRSDRREPGKFQRYANLQVYGLQHQSGLDDFVRCAGGGLVKEMIMVIDRVRFTILSG